MRDKTLTCIQCGNQFVLTVNDQEKLITRGFDFPKRCPDCRKRKFRQVQEDHHDDWGSKKKKKHTRREKFYFEEDI